MRTDSLGRLVYGLITTLVPVKTLRPEAEARRGSCMQINVAVTRR